MRRLRYESTHSSPVHITRSWSAPPWVRAFLRYRHTPASPYLSSSDDISTLSPNHSATLGPTSPAGCGAFPEISAAPWAVLGDF